MPDKIKSVEELNLFVCRGSVLTVIDNQIAFYAMQGEAREFDKEKIGLIFDERIHNLSYAVMGPCAHKCGEIVFFERSQLALDKDWTFENQVKRTFSRNSYIVPYKLKYPFKPGTPCQCEGCHEITTERILVDMDGVIYEFDVCGQHAKQYGGKRPSLFPYKKQSYANLNEVVVPPASISNALQTA